MSERYQEKPLNSNRIAWIDIAKFFGIFFVVLGHTVEADNTLLSILYFFHVPLFFFLSGITYSYKKNQWAFIYSKIKRLYIPYIFVSIVSIFVYLITSSLLGTMSFDMQNFLSCLYGMIYANVSAGNMMWNRPLWFLPTLFVVLIITNLIEAVKNKPLKTVLFISLSALGYYLSSIPIYLPLQTETALSMLIWIYLGIILRKYFMECESQNKLTLAIASVFLVVTGLGVGFYNGSLSVMVDLYGKNILMYMIAAFCLSTATIFVSIIIYKNKILEFIGRNTIFILLWHKFPIEFFQQICPVIKDWIASPNLWLSDITSLVVAIISIVLSLLLEWFYYKFLKLIHVKTRNSEF